MTETVTVKFDPNNFKLRVKEGKRRMKVYIDFQKEETESYKNFELMFKPEELSPVEFAKIVFLKGISTLQQEVQAAIEAKAEEEAKNEQEENKEDSVEETN